MTLQPAPKSLPNYAKDKDRPYVGNPWDRQPNETKKAYSAFLLYRDMEPDERTIAGAERIYRKEHGLAIESKSKLLYNFSSKHRWEERAEAWDNYLAAKKAAALKRRAIKAAEKHADLAADALMVASAPAQKLAQRMREQLENDPDGKDFLDKLTDEDLMRLHKVFGDSMPGFAKMEKDALSGAVDSTPAPQKLNAKAQKLRAIMGNKEVMGLLEQVTVEVSESEAADG